MRKDPRILAQEIHGGIISSFEVFYGAEFDNIVYFVNGYLHDFARAKDIAQEALWTLWEKRETIDPERNIRALVFTIARNRTLNELKSRSLFSNSAALLEIQADMVALADDSLEQMVEALGLEELIERTMGNLPDTVRESFRMSRDQGMTNREIARLKNMSLTGVEYHMKISLTIFRKKLKEYLPLWGWIALFL